LKTLVDFKMKIAGRGIFSKFPVIFPVSREFGCESSRQPPFL
jgi:hypothetical protein